VSDGSGNLVITYTGNGSAEGDVNGLQLQGPFNLSAAPTNDTATYTWSTLAGHPPNGSADGTADTIEFHQPEGVALDSAGNVYVADSGNNTIRKITQGQVSSTIAGIAGISGSNDGAGGAALFNYPVAVAADGAGNLYVADQNNHTIRKLALVNANWMVTTIAGVAGSAGTNDGAAGVARFSNPAGIAADNAGNLWVTDNDTVRMLKLAGTNWVVTTIAGAGGSAGDVDAAGSAARFNSPMGIGVDNSSGQSSGNSNNVYVADSGNNSLRELSPMTNSLGAITNWMVSTITVSGTSFLLPFGVAVDNVFGNVYVTDYTTIRSIEVTGQTGSATTLADQTDFGSARGVAVRYVGGIFDVYWTDDLDNVIRLYQNGTMSAWAGVPTSALNNSDVDGTGIHAQFFFPIGLAVDGGGTVFVTELYGETIRQITAAGEVSTVAGMFDTSGTNDGVANNGALFNSPTAVAQDDGFATSGNVLVADYGSSTIRRIYSQGSGDQGGVVRTVYTAAGVAGSPGNTDGNNMSPRSQLNGPLGIAVGRGSGLGVSQTRNYYVADAGNHTVRKIAWSYGVVLLGSPNWKVTTFAGSAGNTFSLDGAGSAAGFANPEGIAADSAGNLYVVDGDAGARATLIRKITTSAVVSTIGVVGASVAGHVGIAVDSSGNNIYVAYPMPTRQATGNTIKKFTLTGTNWVASTIGGLDGISGSEDGAGSAARFNEPRDIALDSAGNLYVVDYGNGTIRKGVFTAYTPAEPVAFSPPATTGELQVTLLPPEANGQWRFPWETAWRNSGSTATGLAQGEYPVEFRDVPGFLAIPLSGPVAVTNGGTSFLTNQYYPTILPAGAADGGSLTVNIGPSPPGGAGWRFLGDTNAFYPPGFSTNLLGGTYLIQFAPVAGFATPASLSVQVAPGTPTVLAVTYLLASPGPAGVLLPAPVPAGNISDLTDYPFGFNGQLETDVGYGSGVAAGTNVVLTAAHLIFNDQTLSFVSQAWWFYQEEAGIFAPEPLAARGWYVLSGYAAQRSNDVVGGLGPDQSSPQSRNMDVAALYFLSPVANGGYGGFLPSDATPNSWLTSSAEKMLTGYPVDGSEFGLTNIVNGEMYQIGPQPYTLSQATDPVADQQVYTASWFLSYPGNSGGPLDVEFDGYYYPAAIYLGTLFNGTVPYASAVRAIDSNVVNLMTFAAALGDTGTNNSGGGVITIIPSLAVSQSNPGYLILQLGPPSAVQAGAAWELAGQPASYYSTANPSLQEVVTTNPLVLQFRPVPGWKLPTNQTVVLQPGVILTNTASYTVTNPVLVTGSGSVLGITGTPGTVYRLDRGTSLHNGSWQPVSTNLIGTNGFTLLLAQPNTNGSVLFYRAVWLGE